MEEEEAIYNYLGAAIPIYFNYRDSFLPTTMGTYWELHFRFRLKQSHSLRDANVNGILADFERESGWNTKTLRSLPDVRSCNKSRDLGF